MKNNFRKEQLDYLTSLLESLLLHGNNFRIFDQHIRIQNDYFYVVKDHFNPSF